MKKICLLILIFAFIPTLSVFSNGIDGATLPTI